MSAVLERSETAPVRIVIPQRPPRAPRIDVIGPWIVVLVALVAGAFNLAGAPDVQDDEGTYTAQALSVLGGQFAPYTYWYDHPPFGWAQLAPLLGLTDLIGLDASGLVIAARYAILPFFAASAALVWIIVRRVGGGPVAAGLAAAVFVFSPLALGYGRMVFLDNIATFWTLVALALVLSPRQWLFSHASAGAALAMAALSKITALTAGPAVLLAMLDRPKWRTRRFSIAAFLAVGAATLAFFPLLASLRGELLSGPGHVSLQDGLTYQFASRGGSGSIFDEGSSRSALLTGWTSADAVMICIGGLAVLMCLFSRRTRWLPLAVACWALPVVFGRGYLPSMYIISALPLLAIAIGAAVAMTGRAFLRVRPWIGSRWHEVVPAAIVAVLAIITWAAPLDAMFTEDRNADSRAAREWVADNVGRDEVVVVPYSLWADLARAGWDDPWRLIAAEKVDLDSRFEIEHPGGWREIDWIVVGPTVRANIESLQLDRLDDAVRNADLVHEVGEWQIYHLDTSAPGGPAGEMDG